MARKLELTWQPGHNGQGGRWKKIYRGTSYYFSGGCGKSDRSAYQAALNEWRNLKPGLDAEAELQPKPHQQDYQAAIERWSEVQLSATRRGQDDWRELARRKTDELQRRLSRKKPPPIRREDLFEYQLDPIAPETLSEIAEIAHQSAIRLRKAGRAELERILSTTIKPREVIEPKRIKDPFGISTEIEKAVWADRLQAVRSENSVHDESIAGNVDDFLRVKKRQSDSGDLSPERYSNIRRWLHDFRDQVGGSLPITELKARVLASYHAYLADRVTAGDFSSSYAKQFLDTAKMFVRWCWEMEVIPDLPRNISGAGLRFDNRPKKITVYTKDEIRRLLQASGDRTRLYLLLMLNTGFTQKDISDLRHSEVDWERKLITRKRTKTSRHGGVPTVTWPLWDETFRLLELERSEHPEYVLVNENGSPLKTATVDEKGELQKTDNIASVCKRLKQKTKIDGGPRKLRKTAATMLRSRFPGLEQHYLGHAPRSVSERHYATVLQEQFDEAIRWLGDEYGVSEICGSR